MIGQDWLFTKAGATFSFDKMKDIFMNTMLAVFGIGGWEVVLILAVVLILFGAKKLPDLAKGLGQGIREFKKATSEVTQEIQNATREDTSHRQVNYQAPPEKAVADPDSSTTPSSQPKV